MLTLHLFGGFEARLADRPLQGFRSVKNEALLAYLALAANRPHPRAALAGLLWPEEPEEAARRNLRQALFQLRRVLGSAGSALIADQNAVRFEDAGVWTDAAAFTHLLQICSHHEHARPDHCAACMMRYAEAVALYRGEFLQGIFIDDSPALEEWLLMQREWFHARCMEMLDALAEWHEATGAFQIAHRYAQRQIELDPLREEAHRRAMRALALAGQRSAALAAYEACWRLLERELGAPPSPETEALAVQIRDGTLTATAIAPASRRVAAPLHNLPPLSTNLIGREDELTQLRQWLLDSARRLITLTGPGGVGKTQLSLAAATEMRGAFADGVWFVSLAGVDDLDALVTAVGREMGLTIQPTPEPWQQLIDFLAPREALLILDNFEHLLAAAPPLSDLLVKAPRLKVLVTSRARLNLQAEHVLSLSGLAWPEEELAPSPEALQQWSAAQLFLECAQRIDPHFAADASNASAIVAICRLVNGMPLALELAAGWVEMYTCEEIAQAIRSNLDFLATDRSDAPVRQRSVRAAFDYSWRLLQPAEQRMLAQLSVFRGEFGREAALAITGAPTTTLTALVRQSLLQVVKSGRFVMHELLRQFAGDQAVRLADEELLWAVEEAHVRHAHFYLQQLAAHAKALVGTTPQLSAAAIAADLDNIRAAWRWAVEHGEEALLARALDGLARFYELRGLHQEAAQRFREAIDAVQSERLRAALQIEQARACITLARYDDAVAASRAALERARRMNDPGLAAAALLQLGIAANVMGDAHEAEQHLENALPLAHAAEDEPLIAEILAAQAPVRAYLGQDGSPLLHEALAIYRKLGNRRREGLTLNDLAMVATRTHDWDACIRYASAALEVAHTLGEPRFESMTLNILAAAHAERGDYAESDRALLRSVHLARAIGYQIGEVNALNSLGLNHLDRHERRQAREYFEQALVIARRTNYRRGVGVLLANLGNLACDEEEYARSEALQCEALEIARAAEDRYFIALRLNSLGEVRRWQGDYAGALRCFVEAADLAAALGASSIEAKAHAEAGLLYALFGDDARCEQALNRSLWLARRAQSLGSEYRAEAALAWLAFLKEDREEAATMLRSVAERARSAEQKAAEAQALTALGAALIELGKPEEAETALERSLALRQALPGRLMTLAPLAHLVDLKHRNARLREAMCLLEELLLTLGDRLVGGVDDPLVVYAIGGKVLQAVGDARGASLLHRGRQHLLEQASRIPETKLQERVQALLGDSSPLNFC